MKRLTPASVTVMMITVIGLLVTAYFAKLLRAEDAESARLEFRDVPVAVASLEPGTEVTAAHLGVARVPAETLITESILSDRAAIGRVVKEQITPGSMIRSSQLLPPGERPALSVAAGMRAVSIAFPQGAAIVDGLLKAGQYVDVHMTLPLNNDPRLRGGLTMTLLRGVRLLAMTRDGAKPNAGGEVTFELTPEQANILLLARQKGEISLSYNPEGQGTGPVVLANADRATLDELLGHKDEAPRTKTVVVARRVPPPFISESYRGAARSTFQFQGRRRIETPSTHKP